VTKCTDAAGVLSYRMIRRQEDRLQPEPDSTLSARAGPWGRGSVRPRAKRSGPADVHGMAGPLGL
jgi:hypothetical protein